MECLQMNHPGPIPQTQNENYSGAWKLSTYLFKISSCLPGSHYFEFYLKIISLFLFTDLSPVFVHLTMSLGLVYIWINHVACIFAFLLESLVIMFKKLIHVVESWIYSLSVLYKIEFSDYTLITHSCADEYIYCLHFFSSYEQCCYFCICTLVV